MISDLNQHADVAQSFSWNPEGSLIVSSSKDKKLRVLDPRANSVTQVKIFTDYTNIETIMTPTTIQYILSLTLSVNEL